VSDSAVSIWYDYFPAIILNDFSFFVDLDNREAFASSRVDQLGPLVHSKNEIMCLERFPSIGGGSKY